MSLKCRLLLLSHLTVLLGLCGVAFASDGKATKLPKIVIAIGEDEYHAKETLPAFAKAELEEELHGRCVVLQSDNKSDLPGLEALKDADLLIMFMRRRTLPESQLKQFQAYFDAGRPVVALRTSCHAFQNWLEFDKLVLGCHYANHYAAQGTIRIAPAPKQAGNPLLRGIGAAGFVSGSSLYRVLPLANSCVPLLIGTWADKPPEPVAWTNEHKGGRVFFTSLGAPEDFNLPEFRSLLRNGVAWAMEKPDHRK
jgi:type 1 glutamine amidotransferase